jgi:phosphoribosyl 1,2-cyclic phosphodiesterase
MDHARGERIRDTGEAGLLFELAGDARPLRRTPAKRPAPTSATPAPGGAPRTELVVLASSSAGNCSALVHGEGARRRVTLIDAGLSPTRTRKALAAMGLGLDHVDRLLLTHLDTDHCHAGWVRALPRHARFCVHRRHRGRAQRAGITRRFTDVLDDEPYALGHGAVVRSMLQAHDELGVAVFRLDFEDHAGDPLGSLGYATDVGRATPQMVEHLRGVDVLAIESNYCAELQAASDRPAFLKQRIMNGSGHLSNEECRRAVSAIAPTRQVVLLHLSRDCNRPELARRYHEDAGYSVLVASPVEPLEPVVVVRPARVA